MKNILLSIKPQYVAKILNGLKTIEIRKKFPKDYVGWVYIYCTKDKKDFLCEVDNYKELHEKGLAPFRYYLTPKRESKYHKCLNGKVVARFWCDKVEEHKDFGMFPYRDLRFNKATCLSGEDLEDYGFVEGKGYVPLYAIHINKLEIFNEPKELALHTHDNNAIFYTRKWDKKSKCWRIGALTRAPQSFMFIEV